MNPPTPIARAHCRTCRRITRQRLTDSQNGSRPLIATYRCTVCGYERLQLGDDQAGVPDALALCANVMSDYLHRYGATVDEEEFVGELRVQLWRLYLGWDPERGVTFLGYATRFLPARAADYHRQLLGRTGRKPEARSVSTEIAGLDEADQRRGVDPGEHRSPDLARTLARGSRPPREAECELGV